jgi:predicted signal transduction protein with EAL and GGDEF domain
VVSPTRSVPTTPSAGSAGDEFAVILLPGVAGDDDAAERADRLLGCFDEPFRLEAGDIRIGTSVGIAVHADGDAVADKLPRTADADMYRNKHLRRAQRRSGRHGRFRRDQAPKAVEAVEPEAVSTVDSVFVSRSESPRDGAA